jgi:hypothetical protein
MPGLTLRAYGEFLGELLTPRLLQSKEGLEAWHGSPLSWSIGIGPVISFGN